MKSWTKVRKDRRLKVGKVEYQKDAPEHYAGHGQIVCDGWPYTSVVFGSDEGGWEHVSKLSLLNHISNMARVITNGTTITEN